MIETRRFFIHFAGDVYALGPTTKGYPWGDDNELRRETVLDVRHDVAKWYGVEPDGDFDVWPASPHEYGYGQ